MSTRGRIGYLNDDGTVVSIYNHCDNYPKGIGQVLLDHYRDYEKVKKLVSLGDCSSVYENVEPVAGTGEIMDWLKGTRVKANKPHSFDNPHIGVTIAYHRDRGEEWEIVKPRIDKSVDNFLKSDVEEWGYLFMKNGNWFVIDGHVDVNKRKLVPLTQKYINKNKY